MLATPLRNQIDSTYLHEDGAYQCCRHLNECHGSHGPREPNARQHLLGDGWKHQATRTAPGDSNCQSHAPLSMAEVSTGQCDARHEHKSESSSHTDGVGEEDLPVRCAQTQHEHAKQVDRAPSPEHEFKVSAIQGSAGECANAEDQEHLQRSDPRDSAVRSQMHDVDIVGLEQTEGIDETPSVEDDETRETGCRPCPDAAIRRRREREGV
jgi:hypothetical protein